MKFSPGFSQRVLVSVGLAVLVCVLVGQVGRSSLMGDLENWGYDLLVNVRRSPPATPGIVVVDFDDATLERLRTYPVPRATIADLLSRISAQGPELIGLDMLLSDRRSSEEDQSLAAAMSSAGNVIIASQLGSDQLPISDPLPEFCRFDLREVSACQEGAAFAVGFSNLPVDDDGFVRRMFLLPPKGYPALPFAVAIATNYLRKPPLPCRPHAVCLGSMVLPMDDSGLNAALIPDWSPVQVIPAHQVIAGQLAAGALTGRIVLIGQSSAAGNDRHFTPVFRYRQADDGLVMLAGAQIHATAVRTLLRGDAVRVLGARTLRVLDFGVITGLLLLVIALRPQYALLAAIGIGIGLYGAAQLLFAHAHLWIKFASGEVAVLLALPSGVGYRFFEERRLKGRAEVERKQLMRLFSRYVSPEMAEQIWKRRAEVVLAGEDKAVTILFSDIRDFTQQSAGISSRQVLAWLNDYLGEMTVIIERNGGFLNKFIGDGIMVLYGVPVSHGVQEDACSALETALAMLERVEDLNREHAGESSYPRLKIGVGIHTGTVTAGNIGAPDRLEYSVIGETVNLASRLEGLTKEFNAPIVFSADTFELIKTHYQARPLGLAHIRGLHREVQVYTATRSPSKPTPDSCR
jgi:adenylate cyclase